MSNAFTSIMAFVHEHSALAAKAKLEALGIDTIIVNDDPSNPDPHQPLSESYSVCVKEEDELVAREILEETMNDSDMFYSRDI